MQNHFYMYILKCINGAYYVGHTDNIEQRMSQHNLGSISNCYTTDKRPLELVYLEIFSTRDDAFHAERQVKGWSRKKKEAFIKGDWEEIVQLNILQKNGEGALKDILQQVQDERRDDPDLCLLLSPSKHQDERKEARII